MQVSVDSIKVKLQEETKDTKRGIFGTKASTCVLASAAGAIVILHTACKSLGYSTAVQAAKSQAIEDLLQQLEGQAPSSNVTAALDQLDGDWHLLYTSLTIKVWHD